ncbi:hypothetical protein PN36_34905 [Candidatus Thiomargarita nelsonii]|uniref:Uncharacterized protein n=1 Tax=Candidatus Thiomargarita nelsonii TaxID=1003181 RepID=A0A4E0QJK3_9GAMM|nr:hypothetical protein PN36_34905 [Candidatus Thiomargarita nelsonii]
MPDWTRGKLQSGTTFIVPTAKECIHVCGANINTLQPNDSKKEMINYVSNGNAPIARQVL